MRVVLPRSRAAAATVADSESSARAAVRSIDPAWLRSAPRSFEWRLRARSRRPAERFVFQAEWDGVEVFDSARTAVRAGEEWIIEHAEGGVPAGPPTADWERGAEEAVVAAAAFLRRGAPTAHQAKKVWFPLGDGLRPGWEIYFETRDAGAYQTVVDGADGRILFAFPLLRNVAPRGRVFAAPSAPHPSAGAATLEDWAGFPGASECPADIYPAAFSNGAQAGECWTAGAETVGGNADACLDPAGANVCGGRALGSNGVFDYAYSDSYGLSADPVPDRPAALSNAFYWANVLHDWLYRLGFDEQAGAFQADNFGRGGSAGDAVRVDVQDASRTNNASFTTPPDGIAPRMELGLFTGLQRDSAFDGDVIVHEYVHGLTNRMVGGPTNVSGLFLWQSGAMGEGWSDAYAAVFTDDPVMGEYVTRNPLYGIRTVRYDQSPHTFGRFGLGSPVLVPGAGKVIPLPQVHADGEIWATVLWDLYQTLGSGAWETVVTDALALTPLRPSMLDARDAILTAAQLQGNDLCTIWPVFAARGLGASAALNPIESGWANDSAVSVYEAFDLPASCGGSPPLEGLVFFDDAESDAGWTATGLWHRTTQRASSGTASWWFGSEGLGGYGSGLREAGDLISPPIDLTTASTATLEWRQYFRGAGFFQRVDFGSLFAPYLNQDSGRVWISKDDGASWQALTHIAHDTPGAGFAQFQVNLSRFVGSFVLLKFEFDTFDGLDNLHEGWFIDDVRVTAGGDPAVLAASPGSLSFAYEIGGPPPETQSIAVSNAGGPGLSWTAATLGASWLSLDPPAGTEAETLAATASPAGLLPGTYSGAVRIDAGAAGTIDIPATLAVAVPSGPAAAWGFEEAPGGPGVILVDSAGGHDGATAGGGSARVVGVVGDARLFDGYSSWASVPSAPELNPANWTMRAWVKLYSLPDTVGVVASAFGGADGRGWYVAVDQGGRPILMLAQPGSAPWLVAPESITPGRWTMVTATYDAATRSGRLFLDGVQAASATFPGLAPDSTRPLTFAKASWADTWFLHAALDEAMILPRAMTAAEVAADFAQFNPPPDPGNLGLGASWSFDGDLVDDSGNGREAVVSGGAYRAGAVGQALHLGGGASASAPVDELVSSADMTVRAWVRLDGQPTEWGALLSNYDAAFAGWYLGVTASGQAFFGLASKPSSLPSVSTSSSLGADRWRHVAAVYEGRIRRLSIYLDGVLEASRYVPGMTPRTSGTLTFGKASWIDAHPVSADLDEVRIETRAWTAAEVLTDFLSFPTPEPPSPVAWWSFDESAGGSGVALADASGGGHTLSTSGAHQSAQSGVFGPGRAFHGANGWASAPPSTDFASDSFSFSAWVRLERLPGSWGAIFSTYDGSHRGWYVGVRSSGQVVLCVGGEPGFAPWLVSASALEVGKWRHVAATFRGGSRQGIIYIDGEREASATFPAWTPQAGVSPTFARASWVGSGYLSMWADEARLYDSVRSDEEIAAEHAAGAARQTPSPVAEWSFDEGAEAGVYGQARRFSGAPDHLPVAAQAELSPSTFTWTGWVRLDAYPAGFGVIFANHGGDSRGWHGSVYGDGRLILSASGPPSSNPWLLSQTALTPGQWHHVAFAFDGVSRRGSIYLDGSREASAVFPAWAPQSAVGPTFGKASWSDNYYLPVTLDRVRIYDVELSPEEVGEEMF